MAILTLNNLLEKSKEWDKNLKKDLIVTVERLGGDVKLKKISKFEYFDIIESDFKDKDAELLYNCCIDPKLSSDEVLNSFDCRDNPEEVVNKIFTHAEKTELAELVLKESGILGKDIISKVSSDIKN